VAPIVPIGSSDAAVHHFVAAGFLLTDDPHLALWLDVDTDRVFDSLVFRVPWHDPVDDGATRALAIAQRSGHRVVVVVDLPRAGESSVFDDDDAVARRVADAVRSSERQPGVAVFLDGFADHDRGYHPRHGLIDRSFNPRPALYRLIEESAAVKRT
jgi:hypothetical protein